MTHSRSDAVISSITSTDNNDVFAFSIDVSDVADLLVEYVLRVQLRREDEKTVINKEHLHTYLQEIHSKVNAVGAAVWDSEVARPSGTSADNHGITFSLDLAHLYVHADVRVSDEGLQAMVRKRDMGRIVINLRRPPQPSSPHGAGRHASPASCYISRQYKRQTLRTNIMLTWEFHT